MVGSSAATTRRRMKTAKVTWESPCAATMRLVLVKYLSVCEAMLARAQRRGDEPVENGLMAGNERRALVHDRGSLARNPGEVKRP